jgi:hypothetical protein
MLNQDGRVVSEIVQRISQTDKEDEHSIITIPTFTRFILELFFLRFFKTQNQSRF